MLQRAGGKTMPAEVVEYVVRKTDGVPLYVEELTKAILESDFVRDAGDRYELTRPLSGVTIPATLQDLLMARLDRLPSIREVAQLGSILGREFAYEMLQAIGSLDETALEKALTSWSCRIAVSARARAARAIHFQACVGAGRSLPVAAQAHAPILSPPSRRSAGDPLSRDRETQPELVAHHYSQRRR